MSVVSIGLDLAKSVFQVHGVDAAGHTVLRRRLARGELVAFFAKQPACLVGMEACSSAHHWARELVQLGHTVRLIPPQYAKPYVKRNKTDAADAEAICEAVGRPNMRFVPIKTREQQAVLALHRVRALLVRQRTATINALRGLLSEFGVVAGKGTQRISDLNERMGKLSAEALPDEAREALTCLFNQIDDLGLRIHAMERRIIAWHRASEASQRLASAPGVGPITATALVAAVGDGTQFKSARHFAAWLGSHATRPGKRREGTHRPDHQGRRSLPADVADPRRESGGRDNVPQRGDGSALASRAGQPAAGERRGHGCGA